MGSFYFHFIWIPLLRVSSRLLVLSLAFRSVALTQSPFSLPCTHIRVLSHWRTIIHCSELFSFLLVPSCHTLSFFPAMPPWLYPACDRHVGPISSLEWVIRFEVDHDKSLSTLNYLFRICVCVYNDIIYVSFILSIYFHCILYIYIIYMFRICGIKIFKCMPCFRNFHEYQNIHKGRLWGVDT